MGTNSAVNLSKIKVTQGFWRSRMDNIIQEVIPYQWKALNDQIQGAEPSHAIENFRIASGRTKGQFHGLIFQDSDVGKWIEAAAFGLVDSPNSELEAIIDEVVELIKGTQEPDGYLNTYFKVVEPEKKWTDFAMGHEMYCGGHLMEGAIAYFRSTGKRTFLDVMIRYADMLDRRFGEGEGKRVAFCGHPEIELALFKLYEVTKQERYRDLAKFFIDARGNHPEVIDNTAIIAWPELNPSRDYYLDHLPVRSQHDADGHSVRAMYLYCAMADYQRLSPDSELASALASLWGSTTRKRMYVTGGLGSQGMYERFTTDFDLPSDRAYAETCAAIGLIFWAWRMTLLEPHRKYADIIERALYNGALSGISLDGTKYFYVNPLETVPDLCKARKDLDHVKTARVQWFGCACCPPNIARLVCSIGQFICSFEEKKIWIHQLISSVASLETDWGRVGFELSTSYPWEGVMTLVMTDVPDSKGPWDLCIRIPEAATANITVNGEPIPCVENEAGYVSIRRDWKLGETVRMEMKLPVQILHSNPLVREVAGKVAVRKGPFIYCAEETDNGPNLHLLNVDPKAEIKEATLDIVPGAKKLILQGKRWLTEPNRALYSEDKYHEQACDVTLVPYFLWGNRSLGEMSVWLKI